MEKAFTPKIIARIRTDFPAKFGIPRQSGLVPSLEGRIVFEPEYRNPDALRGIEGYSHLWLIWLFSEAALDKWSPTVRPPRLGGNERMGVFATRSPFRPNPIGLSCVKLERIERTEDGDTLLVSGADLMDGTPILDIKPYLAYADAIPDARGGFTDTSARRYLKVVMPDALPDGLSGEKASALRGVLSEDPRPRYQSDPDRVYGFVFSGYEVKFSVSDGVLTVKDITKV